MYFYHALRPIFALTFDFDNTLYNSQPVVNRAEQESLFFLKNYHPALCNMRQLDYNKFRFQLFQEEPEICHNVTYWRWKAFKLALYNAGLSKSEAHLGADCAIEIILDWRSRVNISIETHNILSELSSKWPLVGITNGNLNPNLCGLSSYFTYIFQAGRDGQAKPCQDMYNLTAKRLGISCKNILHIGDSLLRDVKGAIISGMQACWTNEFINQSISIISSKRFFPHLQISRLMSLTKLL